jgi:phenylacetate-CoA ligase
MNMAMPFVRYCLEDMGAYMDQRCPCGRGLPLMGNVAGRVADFLLKKDGTKVAGISLIENTLTKIPGIDQMQIVQKSFNELVLNIVPGMEYNDHVKMELMDYFHKVFNGSLVDIVEVPEIKPLKSGKYRFSICQIPQEN